jgi:zinc and cadmium transporter
MSVFWKIIFFTFVSGVVSLAGGIALLARKHWVAKFAVYFVSFAAGTMLATSFFDLLPEAFKRGQIDSGTLFAWMLSGMLLFFVLERLILHYHRHHHEDCASHHHPAPILMQVADTVHNFIDGIVVAAAFLANPSLGVLTALAVGSHELPQEIGDFSVMLHHGYRRKTVFLVNLGSSLASLLGAIIAYASRAVVVPYLPQLLALAAGHFIYIATADLIPELSSEVPQAKSTHVVALLFMGVFVVWGLTRLLE